MGIVLVIINIIIAMVNIIVAMTTVISVVITDLIILTSMMIRTMSMMTAATNTVMAKKDDGNDVGEEEEGDNVDDGQAAKLTIWTMMAITTMMLMKALL